MTISAFKTSLLAMAMVLVGCQTHEDRPAMTETALANGTNQAFEYTLTTSASKEAVWSLWTDVSTWKDWDRGLQDARLEGAFALGARGTIIPLSGPSASFEVTAFDPFESYTFETRLPLARLEVKRSFVSETPVTIQHEVSFKGLLGGLWGRILGPGFRAALPPTMETLVQLAEQETQES